MTNYGIITDESKNCQIRNYRCQLFQEHVQNVHLNKKSRRNIRFGRCHERFEYYFFFHLPSGKHHAGAASLTPWLRFAQEERGGREE